MKKYLVPILIFTVFFGANLVFAEPRIHKEIGRNYLSKISVQPTESGYLVLVNNNQGDEMKYNLDLKYSIVNWKYRNPNIETDIIGERHESIIQLQGTFKGKKTAKDLKIDANPWYQEWGQGLRPFINSNDKATYFWSIDPNSLKIAGFNATKTGTETIEFNGEQLETIKVKITIKGLPEMVFSATYWFRKSDGQEIKNKMPRGVFASPTIVELVAE